MKTRRAGPQPRLIVVPAGTAPRRRFGPSRRVVGTCVRLIAAIGVLAGTVAGAALSTQPAHAVGIDFECAVGSGEAANRGPEFGGGGATALVPLLTTEDVPEEVSEAGRQEPETDFTLWEVAGARGLLWSYTPMAMGEDGFDSNNPEGSFEDECSLMDAASTYIAQMLWEPSRFLGALTIAVKQQASTEQPFREFYNGRDSLVQSLRDNVFVPALVVAVVVTGLWVATRIHRRAESRETYAGVVGAAIIVILLAAVLTGSFFRTITDAVDDFTVQFNSAAMGLVAPNAEENPSGPCFLPEESIVGGSGNEHLEYNRGKRISSCILYEVLLFNPWTSGQFGSDGSPQVEDLRFGDEDYCERTEYRCQEVHRGSGVNDQGEPVEGQVNLGVQQVIAQGLTRNETILTAPQQPLDEELKTRHNELWTGVQYAVAESYPANYDFWRGTQPTNRMATAVSAFVLNVIAVLLVGVLAILTIFWHGVFFIAWLFLPIAGAIAAFPPARRILKANVGIMVQAIFLRNVFGLVLALMLAVLNMLNMSEGSLALKIFLMLIAAAAIWKVLSSIRSGLMAPTAASWAQTQGVLPEDRSTTGAMAGTARGAMRFSAGAASGLAAARATSMHEGGYRRYRDLAGGMIRSGSTSGATDGRQQPMAKSEPSRRTRVEQRHEVEERAQARRGQADVRRPEDTDGTPERGEERDR